MDIRVAITNLDLHNRWRRGEFEVPPVSAKELGETIETIVTWGNGVINDLDFLPEEVEIFEKAKSVVIDEHNKEKMTALKAFGFAARWMRNEIRQKTLNKKQ